MLPTTYDALKSILKADPSVSVPDRNNLLNLLRTGPALSRSTQPAEARLIRRGEVAKRLSCSLRAVDKLAAEGVLVKHRLPGRKRSAGFLEADLAALILNGAILLPAAQQRAAGI